MRVPQDKLRIPSWHAEIRVPPKIARTLAGAHEACIVSNLGTVTDDHLESLSDEILFVPPVRHCSTMSIGLIKMGDRLTLTCSAHALHETIRGIMENILSDIGLTWEEIGAWESDS